MSFIKIVLKDKTELIVDQVNFPADIIKCYNTKEELLSVWNMLTDDNMSEMEVYEGDVKTMVLENYTLDGIQTVINDDGTITGHFYLRDGVYKSVVVDEVAEAEKKEILDKVAKYGGFKTKQVQSDKLGFDWIEEYLGEILLTKTYVQQTNPVGTKDNPIEYSDGIQLIDNAYYMKDGKLVVYMDGEFAEI